jgi:hypothetical protein
MSNRPIMSRLRRANPVPRPRDGDAADLFARITALPADPRLNGPRRRHPLRRRRAVVLAFATLLLAALLASTAVAVSHWIGGDVVEAPVTRHEYLDAQKQLTLPPGVEWPDPLEIGLSSEPDNSVTSRGAGGSMAVLISMNAWECYWAEALRTGEGAAARRAQAKLNALLTNNVLEAPAGAHENWTPTPLPTVPFAVFAHDGGLDFVRGTYDQAAAGDPRGVAQSCRANAPR